MNTPARLNIILRTADRTRKAELEVSPHQHCGTIVDAAIQNWNLPADTQYSLTNVSKGLTLNPATQLGQTSVTTGDILELQPVLLAGASDERL